MESRSKIKTFDYFSSNSDVKAYIFKSFNIGKFIFHFSQAFIFYSFFLNLAKGSHLLFLRFYNTNFLANKLFIVVTLAAVKAFNYINLVC